MNIRWSSGQVGLRLMLDPLLHIVDVWGHSHTTTGLIVILLACTLNSRDDTRKLGKNTVIFFCLKVSALNVIISLMGDVYSRKLSAVNAVVTYGY